MCWLPGLILSLILCLEPLTAFANGQPIQTVLLAILARNKAHVLPDYLKCIENLDYNKKAITIYINTNNNEDETFEILNEWAKKNRKRYHKIIFNVHEVTDLAPTKPHEWTVQRFKVLGGIRNRSLQVAKERNCHFYFVVDCDNFITPCTLSELIKKNKPIIAPMLRAIPEPGDPYSNFVCDINEGGYEKDHPDYDLILQRKKTGIFRVPIVHCTYLIKTQFLDRLGYIDNTKHHEFVVFSRMARNNGVPQFICNEKNFGVLLHHSTKLTLREEQLAVKKLGSLVQK